MDWDTGNWAIAAKATYTGSMDLRKFYEDASDPASFACNEDGTQKLAKGRRSGRSGTKLIKCSKRSVGSSGSMHLSHTSV